MLSFSEHTHIEENSLTFKGLKNVHSFSRSCDVLKLSTAASILRRLTDLFSGSLSFSCPITTKAQWIKHPEQSLVCCRLGGGTGGASETHNQGLCAAGERAHRQEGRISDKDTEGHTRRRMISMVDVSTIPPQPVTHTTTKPGSAEWCGK